MGRQMVMKRGASIRLVAACVIASLLLFAVVALVATPEAEAWSWSSTVTMNGSATHAGGWAGSGWLFYRTSQGECGYAWLGSGTLYGKPYSFTLRSVPFGGTWVCISAGGAGWSHSDGFRVLRPAFGTSGTRNLYWP